MSCAWYGALWLSGHMWPHVDMCTLQIRERPLEISVKLDHFSHNLIAVSLTEDVTRLSLSVVCVHAVITYWVFSKSHILGCVL